MSRRLSWKADALPIELHPQFGIDCSAGPDENATCRVHRRSRLTKARSGERLAPPIFDRTIRLARAVEDNAIKLAAIAVKYSQALADMIRKAEIEHAGGARFRNAL